MSSNQITNIKSEDKSNSVVKTESNAGAASGASSSSASGSRVSMANSGRAVWLVRVPEFVMEAWRTLPGDSALGQLRVHADGKLSLQLANPRDSDAQAAVSIPTEYVMACDAKPAPMELFSETDELPAEYAFEGLVEQRCDVTPVVNEQYGRLMAERRSAVARDAKRPRVLLDTEKRIVGVGLTKARRTQMEQASLISTKARSNKDRNRVQMPARDLTAKILALFERTPELPIADIDHECQQPINYLKDVLATVADFVRARKVWVLKPEYRHAPADAATASTSGNNKLHALGNDDDDVE